MRDCLCRSFSAFGLCGSKRAGEGDQHGGVDGAGVVEQGADDLLKACDAGSSKWCRGIGGCNKLRGGAINRARPGIRGVLRSRRRGVTETGKCLGDVARHRQVDGACGVIPRKRETAILGASPIDGDGVKGLERLNKMCSMLATNVFDTEVVYGEAETDGAVGMREETGGQRCRKQFRRRRRG